jgi:gamma-glutamyltranspeptidase / glutathione hydrolase
VTRSYPHTSRSRSTATARFALLASFLLVPLLQGCGEGRAGTSAADARGPHADIQFPDGWRYSAEDRPVFAARGMVSTAEDHATLAGLRVLEEGGNAVDAAVAVSFALAVTLPRAGNIGGGGFMVIRDADGGAYALDYREKAPLAAYRDMYLDEDGELTDRSVLGHLAAGVPGAVAGLWEAHRRFGNLPWDRLVQPAVELAEGFEVSEELARSIRGSQRSLALYEGTREIFLPGGEPPSPGTIFRQTDLARTLERIRDQGPDGFYRGETADLIVAEMERGGGIITHRDLDEYEAIWREPITFTYRDHTIHSMPPSSSGGATLAMMANMVEPHDVAAMGWQSVEYVHLLTEVWKRAYADRNQVLADPDFVDVPLARMISKEYALERGRDLDLGRATPSEEIGPGLEVREGDNTTHFSIVDQEGIAVAVTTTINSSYGNKVTVAGAGFLLNNEMDDFAAKPGFPNQFGLVQGEQNAIEPGKRMLSAMTPTVVVGPDGRLFFVTGTPGGSTIITTVFQTIVNVVDFGMSVAQAVNAPRVHHQHLPDEIRFENGGMEPDVVRELEALGHIVLERPGTSGNVQAIMVLPDGTLAGWADHRLAGSARGH